MQTYHQGLPRDLLHFGDTLGNEYALTALHCGTLHWTGIGCGSG